MTIMTIIIIIMIIIIIITITIAIAIIIIIIIIITTIGSMFSNYALFHFADVPVDTIMPL